MSTVSGSGSSRWKVYKQRGGRWGGLWVAQPPGADFDGSFVFGMLSHAVDYATLQATAESGLTQLEDWLKQQPKPGGYWGQPSSRNDDGTLR